MSVKQYGFVLSALLLAGSVTFGADATPTVDEVIARYIKAIGGREKIDSVKTMKVSGKTIFGGGMESPTTLETKRPNKMRMEFTFQGMTGTRAYDGKTGWSIMPFMGKTDPEKMSEDEVKDMEEQADMDGPLVDYQKKGNKVELLGKEDVEGSSAYKVKVTKKDESVQYHFLDAETFLPVKIVAKMKRHGTEMEVEQILSDYKSIGGLMVAHSMQNRAAGQGGMGGGMNMVFDKVEVNVDIPDDRFAMPEAKKAEAPEKKEK